MKKMLLGFLLPLCLVSHAENILSTSYTTTGVRYWFDRKDKIHTCSYDASNGFVLDASELTDGTHTLYYQLVTKDGETSPTMSRVFIRITEDGDKGVLADNYESTDVRYWFDRKDKIHTCSYDASNGFVLDASELTDGTHTLYYQLVTKDGETSPTMSRVFIRITEDGDKGVLADNYESTDVRYWFDRKDKIHTCSYDASNGFVLDASELTDGTHTLYYQLVTKDGETSPTISRVFIRITEDGDKGVLADNYEVKSVRYWFDTENDIYTCLYDASNGFILDASKTEEGQHTLNYQLITDDGHASPTFRKTFDRSIFDITVSTTQTLSEKNYPKEMLDNKPWVGVINHTDNAAATGHFTVEQGDTLSMGRYVQRLHYGSATNSQKFTGNGENYYHLTTLKNDGMMRADSVFVEMTFYKDRWHFISVPFNVKVTDIKTQKGVRWVIRTYDGAERAAGHMASTWKNLTASDMLTARQGYIIQATRDDGQNTCRFVFSAINDVNKNNLFGTENRNVALNEHPAEFAHNRSWNFVANPYPSFFDSRATDFNAPITVWNGSGYTAYSPTDDNYVLMPFEGFFVQCPVNTDQFIFQADGRQHSHTARERAPQVRATATDDRRHAHNFTLSDETFTDRCRIVINEKASAGYEMERDAGKFMSSEADVPQIYTTAERVAYAINERPLNNGTVAITLYTGRGGRLILHYEPGSNALEHVTLVDAQSGQSYDLRHEDAELYLKAGTTVKGRYYIVFADPTTAIENLKKDVETTDGNNDAMYDIEGRRVVSPHPNGVYIKNGTKYIEHNKQR